ncbi:hypothetical protein F971_01981 [Acinetobacter vivianii]|uniref:Uncharacterized protein n=1 Tax=Acinetobacter vivianii TaxID=1776742 RepID=N8WAY2_9GAMM|nr:hypothetical protein [Acinetobacter vivianii]ENU92094.1 hypothetical protein F971_01981 [Acinetobacter vivianii]
MGFVTTQDVNERLGDDFAPEGDKAHLVLLANTWMRKKIGFIPDKIDPLLKYAACEIVKGIKAKAIYNGQEQLLKRKKVKGDTVESEREYQEGSTSISSYEQIATDIIDTLELKNPNGSSGGFTIRLIRT